MISVLYDNNYFGEITHPSDLVELIRGSGETEPSRFSLDIESHKIYLDTAIMDICDSKHRLMLVALKGVKASPEQHYRYERKYRLAQKGAFDPSENEEIIAAYEKDQYDEDAFLLMIEKVRKVAMGLNKQGKVEKVTALLTIAAGWGIDVTSSEVEAMLG